MSRSVADQPTAGSAATAPVRAPMEWVTFAVAAAVIVAVVVLIATEIPASRQPPRPVAEPGAVVERGSSFVVPVVVVNRGERTAEEVQVEATLTIDGEEQRGDQVIDFLSGGEEEELQFVFADDPDDGSLDVRVTGYGVP